MIESSDGDAVTTGRLKCRPSFDDNGFPFLIDFQLGDGSEWVYRSAGGDRMACLAMTHPSGEKAS